MGGLDSHSDLWCYILETFLGAALISRSFFLELRQMKQWKTDARCFGTNSSTSEGVKVVLTQLKRQHNDRPNWSVQVVSGCPGAD